MKKILVFCLLGLALVGAGVAVKRRVDVAGAAPVVLAEEAKDPLPADGVVVTYFTTDVRCPSCLKIEALTRQAVEKFVKEGGGEKVVFRVVNLDRPENQHFTDEYSLVSKTVVVSVREGGKEVRWKNLQDVWLKLNDPEEFERYVLLAIR